MDCDETSGLQKQCKSSTTRAELICFVDFCTSFRCLSGVGGLSSTLWYTCTPKPTQTDLSVRVRFVSEKKIADDFWMMLVTSLHGDFFV